MWYFAPPAISTTHHNMFYLIIWKRSSANPVLLTGERNQIRATKRACARYFRCSYRSLPDTNAPLPDIYCFAIKTTFMVYAASTGWFIDKTSNIRHYGSISFSTNHRLPINTNKTGNVSIEIRFRNGTLTEKLDK